jgi:DNA-binding transcriptional ArsR family regulator
VIRYRFGQDDLLRTRFAITPLMDLIGALYVLRRPGRSVVHRPWAEWAGPRTASLDLSLLDIASPLGTRYWPVFVGPPPLTPHAEIGDELRRVSATPPDRVREEITRAYPSGPPAAARPFVEDPGAALRELVAQMAAFWDAALAPWWPAIEAVLEAEIASRARRLAATGSRSAFDDLHPTVTWDGGTLHIRPTSKEPAEVELAGRGLLLVPSAFVWPTVWPRTDPPWDPALVYPPAGIGDLWAPDEPSGNALEALIGRRRARILRDLARPASTLELAHRLTISPGGVSDHLRVLHQAGLVTRRREGRQVIYARTKKGHLLCGPG